MIPQDKIASVNKALNSVFGTSEMEDVKKITIGLSGALVLRIVVQGKPYLLRIITRTDAMGDPSRHYSYMKAAAEIGVAPKVWFMSVEDRFSITDFIEAKPFPIHEARAKMPELIRKVHMLPVFHPVMNVFDMAHFYLQKVKTLKILSEADYSELFEAYQQIAAVYPKEKEDLVSCHNDLKPENIIYDGNRPWLVDWEAAFLNYRYADLAILAHFVLQNEGDEKNFLKAYLAGEPSEYDIACFYLIRQISHINYFTVFFSILASAGFEIDTTFIPDLDFYEFHDRMWKGEISLAGNESRLEYALIHWRQFQGNIRSKQFRDAINVVLKSAKN